MADEALIDPSTIPHKEQQHLLARLRHDGMRSDAYNRITDYRNATPTFKKVPKKRKSRAKTKLVGLDEGGQTVEMEVTDPKIVRNLDAGRIHAYSIPEDAVPYHPNSKSALLTRLNANLRP